MPWLPKSFLSSFFMLALACLLTGGLIVPALCGPPSAAPQASHAPTTPDYGGRDSLGTLQSAEAGDVSPAAQGLRALESLVLVLALVAGGVYGAKRLGLVSKDGRFSMTPGAFLPKPSRGTKEGDPIAVISSQPLPGGGGLHVVSVSGRTLLLGATAQSVMLLAELDVPASEKAPNTAKDASDTAFAALLARDEAQTGVPALSETADRLQTLLSRSRSVSPTGTFR